MKHLVAMVALVAASCGAASAQTKQQEQQDETDGFKLAGCILSTVLGGVTDPGAIATTCAQVIPAAVVDIYSTIVDVIDDYEAQHGDAGVAATAAAIDVNQRKLLDTAKANALAAKAQKATSK